ncbi:hypothetical protein CAPTEDRAFT_201977 [Capitella teleta]|uniref:Reverse transcriptase domain-containing protein n=1 Tax=Capitella teleta TaxID=283909 RepID=R7V127_CAPTE|nr:hypothetical protein CAPTEDRAFT_201977 [Capitella teleta]|eukprot:ELU09927.1 hypothetical protein CAPTEDRAFT_201977 [Capitella teleta]
MIELTLKTLHIGRRHHESHFAHRSPALCNRTAIRGGSRSSRVSVGRPFQQLEHAIQLITTAMGNRMTAMGDRITTMEQRVTAQISSQEQHQCCDVATSIVSDYNRLHQESIDRGQENVVAIVRDFNQNNRESLDKRSLAVDSKLLEMRRDIQSAVDQVSTTERRLVSHNGNLSENMTSLIAEFTEHLTTQMKDRMEVMENRTRGRNTTQALVSVVDRISRSFEQGEVTIGVMLDFQKTVDTIQHKIILSKFLRHGIRGTPHRWFTTYRDVNKG